MSGLAFPWLPLGVLAVVLATYWLAETVRDTVRWVRLRVDTPRLCQIHIVNEEGFHVRSLRVTREGMYRLLDEVERGTIR